MLTLRLPQAGQSMVSGTVKRWLKKAGDSLAKGELIALVETELGLVELESPCKGVLGRLHVGEGATVKAHGSLADVEESKIAGSEPQAVKREGSALVTPVPSTSSKLESGPAVTAPSGPVVPILMPQAGQSMEEGTILKWHVQSGAAIKKGDVIFEVETDKASMDVEATDSGRLARIILPEGGTLAVLQPVAYLAESDADLEAYLAASGIEAPAAAVTPAAAATKADAPAGAGVFGSGGAGAPSRSDTGRVKASPAARRLAEERGIDLNQVAAGSGPGGRILSTDVPRERPALRPAAGPSRRPMSSMRKAIAKALVHSKQSIPHFYVRLTVEADRLMAFYREEKAKAACTVNDVVVLACAKVIAEYPAFRSRIEGDEIAEFSSVNIGIAVGTDDGLVVPVLTGVERMSLGQIGAETKRLAASARGGKIEKMGQGTFTITNLGMFGTEEFSAIINPPEAAIMAVGAVREAVLVKDGAMRPGKVMTVTLSADHRVIDGLLAAKFLADLKQRLENPEVLRVA